MNTELVQNLKQVNAGYWADTCGINLQASKFSFHDHDYQKEPMGSKVRRVCYMKGTQGGFSELEILKSLHGMIYKKYPQGVLYMFPTSDDVGEFSKSRFNPLILSNRKVIGQYVKNTDTTSLKKIHKAFLYLRGARLAQKISGDQNESSKVRGIPVDRVVFDEEDLMDEEVKGKARGRMGHSTVKEEVYISNPTIPEYGVDKTFALSDQRHWFRKCTCGHWTCAELSFPDCVKLRKDGTGYIGCDKCGKELGINGNAGVMGNWIPQKPENTDYMHGYRWSQLTSTFNDPAEILSQFNDPPEGNLGDIYRLRLGLPYIAAEDRLTEAQVFRCCNRDIPPVSHRGPCAMGVDVGKIKHVIIGIRTGDDQYQILRAVRLSDWNDIHDIARRFNVKSAVIDIRPYEDAARAFQKAESYRIHLCEYNETTTAGPQFNANTGVVKVNRTEIFDATHRMIDTEGMLTIPRTCPEVKELARQLCNTAKVLETNKKTQRSVYRYKKLGDEHFRNALNYFKLACSGGKVARVDKSRKRQTHAVNNWKVA